MALHRGFGFPFNLNGSLVQTDEALIDSSVLQIIGTAPRERVRRPEFGADLPGVVFRLNDSADAAKHLLAYRITEAIERWDTRLRVTSVSFHESPQSIDEGEIASEVRMVIVATGEEKTARFALRKGVNPTQ
ncbi:MAG: GPW/gp25 family protein [Sumerlaeia bacterium]